MAAQIEIELEWMHDYCVDNCSWRDVSAPIASLVLEKEASVVSFLCNDKCDCWVIVVVVDGGF